MANTVTEGQLTITISDIDDDWDSEDHHYIDSIIFVPGAQNDVCVIKEGSASGPELFVGANYTNKEPRIAYYKGYIGRRLFLDYSECTISTNGLVIINLRKAIWVEQT